MCGIVQKIKMDCSCPERIKIFKKMAYATLKVSLKLNCAGYFKAPWVAENIITL